MRWLVSCRPSWIGVFAHGNISKRRAGCLTTNYKQRRRKVLRSASNGLHSRVYRSEYPSPMEDYKTLLAERGSKRHTPNSQKKDKLAETKKRQAEIKAALKEERDNKKNEKTEEKAAVAHEVKVHRLQENPNSKRAQKDVRHLEQRERRKSGQFCEHGVWKCKICFPYDKEK